VKPYDDVLDVAGGAATTNEHLIFVLIFGRRRTFLVIHDALLQHALPDPHTQVPVHIHHNLTQHNVLFVKNLSIIVTHFFHFYPRAAS